MVSWANDVESSAGFVWAPPCAKLVIWANVLFALVNLLYHVLAERTALYVVVTAPYAVLTPLKVAGISATAEGKIAKNGVSVCVTLVLGKEEEDIIIVAVIACIKVLFIPFNNFK
jgi:hypothetical protein